MRAPRSVFVVLLLAALLGHVASVAAQDGATPAADPNAPVAERSASPVPDDGERLDLAAIVLPGEAMPAGYTLAYETYVAGVDVSEQLLGGLVSAPEVAKTGIRWFYESQYESADGQTRIRSYLEEYPSAAEARAGFDLFENEDLFTSPGVASVDKPGIGVGEEPSELTVSTVEATATTPSGASLDATFRIDRLIVGVAIDTVTTTPPSEDDLQALATALADRVEAVLAGKELPGVDPALPAGTLQFPGALPVQEGYVALGDVYGDQAPDAAGASFQSGYVRTSALGTATNPDLPVPVVSVMMLAFSSESGPLAILSGADDLMPAFSGLQREPIDRVPGASAAIGYQFASPIIGGAPDSFRVVAVVGERLVSVDVQGASSVDAARAAALDLLAQQIDCTGSAACGAAALPAGLVP